MKSKILVLLLIPCILGGSFSRFFVFAGFELNQKYIAATLCENRDKPWLHCDGKCYFMKKIKQAEEREKSDERQSQKNQLQENYFEVSSTIQFYSRLLRIINTPYQAPVPPQVSRVILRPPQLG